MPLALVVSTSETHPADALAAWLRQNNQAHRPTAMGRTRRSVVDEEHVIQNPKRLWQHIELLRDIFAEPGVASTALATFIRVRQVVLDTLAG